MLERKIQLELAPHKPEAAQEQSGSGAVRIHPQTTGKQTTKQTVIPCQFNCKSISIFLPEKYGKKQGGEIKSKSTCQKRCTVCQDSANITILLFSFKFCFAFIQDNTRKTNIPSYSLPI